MECIIKSYLARAVTDDSRLAKGMGNMTTREQKHLLDQLAADPPSSSRRIKVVVVMVRQFAGDQLDNVVRIQSRELILLTQVPAGARCQVPAGQPHQSVQGAGSAWSTPTLT